MRKEVKASKKYWFVYDEELNNPCAFDAFLFNDPAHLALQPSTNRHSYYLIKKHDEVIHARITFFIENNIAHSPYKGSFGSIEYSDKIFFELLNEFWDNIEMDLKGNGVKEISIKNYPVCYSPSHAQMLSFLFFNKGFLVKSQELNFHIEVDEIPFEKKIHENERKKLVKSLKQGYSFHKEENPDIYCVYEFIDRSRKRKDYPTTLKIEELQRLIEKFPDQFLVYSLRDNENLAALCVLIKINESFLYTFYGADSEEYLKDSPLVLLHYNLYNYGRENSFKLIDLGIGSEGGETNQGLARFKEKIGGVISVKLIWAKKVIFIDNT